jgi:hypothetical protein
MTSKEKKEYIVFGVALALILIVLGFYFFGGSHGSSGAGSSAVSDSSVLSGTATAAGAPVQGSSAGILLPNGADIDLSILNDPRFKSLVPPQYPWVNKTEIGSQNPFK